ncbi:uncharacterized protein [Coffea arabica]|uniref:Reverse transcriptase domain-containing protein n=1 Tax=Coffea arabica TaxID=13443 RepID=A0ABM4VBZ6_COFAR
MLDQINILVWNIRGASRRDSLRYLKRLCHENNVRLLILIEPMSLKGQLEVVRRYLNFDFSALYIDGKIWVFWSCLVQISCVEYAEQMIHAQVSFASGASFWLSAVYIRCTRVGRRPLWEAMESVTSLVSLNQPWVAAGDFNVIAAVEEREGGAPTNVQNMDEFNASMFNCGLSAIDFDGSRFTWTNGSIWQRLDRRHPQFREIVSEAWSKEVYGMGMVRFYNKLKMVRDKLKHWNREVFGNVSSKMQAPSELPFEVPRVTQADNELMKRLPMMEEIHEDFFQGMEQPKSWFHSLLVLIAKVEGFVLGRGIVDNVLLAQELVLDLDRRLVDPNLILKLDMEKAYDRVNWSFLLFMLRQYGFEEAVVDLLFCTFSNSWFSVLINGEPTGFVKSYQGVWQEDPLSPTLFLFMAEFLGRGLQGIFDSKDSRHFVSAGSKVPYLAFADDMIIFTRCSQDALVSIRDFLQLYQHCFGQKVNTTKSVFCASSRITDTQLTLVSTALGYQRQGFPFRYLGVPLIRDRVTCAAFDGLLGRVLQPPKDEQWLRLLLLGHLVSKILDLHIFPNTRDPMIWAASPSGSFTVSSAWEVLRSKYNRSAIDSLVWSSVVPLKISLFAWRLLRGWLPLDDLFQGRGLRLASKCYCCGRAPETGDHLFVSGPLASSVWRHFSHIFGLMVQGSGVVTRLASWLLSHWFVSQNHIRVILPLSILWFLWKGLSKARFEGMSMLSNQIINQVCTFLDQLGRGSLLRVEYFKEDTDYAWVHYGKVNEKLVQFRAFSWVKSPEQAMKLNTDASVVSGRASGGGVVRSAEGDLVFAFYKEFGDQNVLSAEALALLEGLRSCQDNNLRGFVVEVDSSTLVSVVSSKLPSRWPLCNIIRHIQFLAANLGVSLVHTFREANAVADALASLNLQSDVRFSSDIDLPSKVQSLLQLDKLSTSYVRLCTVSG